MPTLINPYAYAPGTMLSAIQRLSLTTGLKLCLDAGDINSVASGTQDKWLDTSGNGYDFFRGTGTGSDAADPTFNGVVGSQSSSEYWGFDGGDWFTYDTTNETWMQNVHKDGAKFAFAFWFYMTAYAPGESPYLAADNAGSTSKIGFNINVRDASPVVRFGVTNGTGSVARNIDSTATVSTNQWTFIGMTIDEAADAATCQINATQNATAASYTSPSASAATHTMAIASNANAGSSVPPNGSRMASVTMWESAVPTATELLTLYNTTKAKFGH